MALRRILGSFNVRPLAHRYIMTSSWDFAKAEEELERNPYYEKYADKLRQFQDNHKEEYLAKLKARDEAKKSVEEKDKLLDPVPSKSYPGPRSGGSFRRKQLGDIMNLDLLNKKSPEEISEIWKEYYKSKEDVIYGTLSKNEFQNFIPYCRQYPVFVVPLPRGDGFEFFMVQFSDDQFHLTPLILYHKYKEESPEALCVSYFNDLPQDVVLVLGEYDKKVLSPIEAQCLLNSLQLFYHNEHRRKLIRKFNESPDSFDYNDLIREINSLSLEKQ